MYLAPSRRYTRWIIQNCSDALVSVKRMLFDKLKLKYISLANFSTSKLHRPNEAICVGDASATCRAQVWRVGQTSAG
jgi:hypothetical protein